jgi:hypothetical protein
MTGRDPETPLAGLAAQVLASDETPAPQRVLENRPSQIHAIECALRSRSRRRWLPWAAGAGVTAAAAVVLLAWQASPTRMTGPAALAQVENVQGRVTVEDRERELPAGEEIVPGTRLRVPRSGGLTLRLSTGTRIGLRGGAAVRVADLGSVNRFDLQEGGLAARVNKLAPGHRFVVATPDAEIEVKGTQFDVTVTPHSSTCNPRTRTSVDVQEGVVVVRFRSQELRVPAGHHWPECEPAPPVASPIERQRADAPRSRRRAARASTRADHTPAPSSTLAEQNDLLAAALAAERRGDLEEAERWLDRLTSRYPDGQLTDSARTERHRLAAVRARAHKTIDP